MKVQEVKIAGKKYLYVLCRRCGVWIEAKDYDLTKKPAHEKCDEFVKSKRTREKATKKVLGLLNRVEV